MKLMEYREIKKNNAIYLFGIELTLWNSMKIDRIVLASHLAAQIATECGTVVTLNRFECVFIEILRSFNVLLWFFLDMMKICWFRMVLQGRLEAQLIKICKIAEGREGDGEGLLAGH